MQCRRIIGCLLAFLILASSAQAQKEDWQAVQGLQPGVQIWVKTDRSIPCSFEGATDSELICEPPHPPFIRRGQSSIRIDRQSVREVRLAHCPKNAAIAGAVIGGGTLAILGASKSSPNRGWNAFFGGLAGGFAGYLGGLIVGTVVAIVHHGKVIYRR